MIMHGFANPKCRGLLTKKLIVNNASFWFILYGPFKYLKGLLLLK